MFPTVWYHGSPYCCLSSSRDFDTQVVFVTDSRLVAEEYVKPLLASGRRPKRDVADRPTIYVLTLNLPEAYVFDTRRPECLAVFMEIVRISREQDDPDDAFRKSDIVSVPAARGSSIGGRFPSYGKARLLVPRLESWGYQAAFIGEGTQGASLAVMNPGQNLTIQETWIANA